MKSVSLVLAGVLAAALPALALAQPESDELIGQYTLVREVAGTCYPEITVRKEDFPNAYSNGLGIYGAPGSGEIVFQLMDIGSGKRSMTAINPMTGALMGYATWESVVENGKIEAHITHSDVMGNIEGQASLTGTFGNGALSFTVDNVNNLSTPSTSSHSECSYQKH